MAIESLDFYEMPTSADDAHPQVVALVLSTQNLSKLARINCYRSLSPTAEILVISPNANAVITRRCHALGVCGVISSGLDANLFADAVGKILDGKTFAKEARFSALVDLSHRMNHTLDAQRMVPPNALHPESSGARYRQNTRYVSAIAK